MKRCVGSLVDGLLLEGPWGTFAQSRAAPGSLAGRGGTRGTLRELRSVTGRSRVPAGAGRYSRDPEGPSLSHGPLQGPWRAGVVLEGP